MRDFAVPSIAGVRPADTAKAPRPLGEAAAWRRAARGIAQWPPRLAPV
ncbi:hypothetical protein GA0115257_105737 [Streptomyces sp. LcepLS]|nr:hypothetical protein GA0115257_105737 [Streptomyces sp. LcepLS]